MDHWALPLAKVATTVGTVGSGVAAVSIEANKMLGYTLEEWQMIAIIAAAISGVGGLLITALFKYLHYRLEVKKVHKE